MTKFYAGAAAAAIAAAVAGTYAYTEFLAADDQFAQCRTASIAGAADIGGPFTLVDASGETVTDKDVITKPSLIYFGYTFCPDVCPFDVSRNAIAVDILEEQGVEVTPIFISIDPERDTPEQIGAYAENMHPRMIALTGSDDQVKAASQAYRTYYRRQDGDDEYYLVDHSTFSYLVLPEVGFVEFYRREATAEAMAESIACFVNAV